MTTATRGGDLVPMALATGGALLVAELLNRFAADALRTASAALAGGILRAAGNSVVREEMTLVTSWGRFDVLLPCSGGKFLAATLALGALVLVSTPAPAWRRAAVAAALVPLALAGNAWRVAALVWSGAPASGWLHTALGLQAFAAVVLTLAVAAGWRNRGP